MEKENEEKKPVFKEFCVDGKILGRWVKEKSVTEYDERGNEIHYKNSDGMNIGTNTSTGRTAR